MSKFDTAIKQICEEKGLSKAVVLETMEAALASAYRKDFGTSKQKIKTIFDPETGKIRVFQVFEVVAKEDLENPEAQKTKTEAQKIKKGAKIGDEVEIEIKNPPQEFGRIAAQTAKQVIIQRIREAERNVLMEEFQKKENTVVNGVVQQLEPRAVVINLGKINGIIPISEQIPGERYYIGQRLRAYVKAVEETTKGPSIILSRSDPELIRELFALEVPEINSGSVEIKEIAREAGRRTKIAVLAHQEGVDPVGSCIGQRGTRVQAILNEIGNEKIDIVLWDKDPRTYIINALSPARIEDVKLKKYKKKKDGMQGTAEVRVAHDQLSLAIGKEGQNVRLASKLVGWNIDVSKSEELNTEKAATSKSSDEKEAVKIKKDKEKTTKLKKTRSKTDKKQKTSSTKNS